MNNQFLITGFSIRLLDLVMTRPKLPVANPIACGIDKLGRWSETMHDQCLRYLLFSIVFHDAPLNPYLDSLTPAGDYSPLDQISC
jgi:hypothetical protein